MLTMSTIYTRTLPTKDPEDDPKKQWCDQIREDKKSPLQTVERKVKDRMK